MRVIQRVLSWRWWRHFHKLRTFSHRRRTAQKHDTMVSGIKWSLRFFRSPSSAFCRRDAIHDRFLIRIVVAANFIIYGILFIVIENHNERSCRREMNSGKAFTYRWPFIIGVFQVPSLIPGTQTVRATIVGGILIAFQDCGGWVYFSNFVMFGASL